MKRIKIGAAILGLLVMGSPASAQVVDGRAAYAGKADQQTQKMDEALERLKSTMSKGGSESVAGAGHGVFMNLTDFGRSAAVDASPVRSDSPAQFKRKAGLVKAAGTCWEVCVKFGPLNVCYTWETRCR